MVTLLSKIDDIVYLLIFKIYIYHYFVLKLLHKRHTTILHRRIKEKKGGGLTQIAATVTLWFFEFIYSFPWILSVLICSPFFNLDVDCYSHISSLQVDFGEGSDICAMNNLNSQVFKSFASLFMIRHTDLACIPAYFNKFELYAKKFICN